MLDMLILRMDPYWGPLLRGQSSFIPGGVPPPSAVLVVCCPLHTLSYVGATAPHHFKDNFMIQCNSKVDQELILKLNTTTK